MKDFYPTPIELAYKMLENTDLKTVKTVLEPSAGKGDLADAVKIVYEQQCKEYYSQLGLKFRHTVERVSPEVECIEIDPELQMTLKGKGYRVIYNDFLKFHTFKQYDLILANFPFSNGAKHFLHALDMCQYGGHIVGVVNAETLKNPYTNERQDLGLRLEKYGADIRFVENAFADAEHKTSVEVAIIDVTVPKEKGVSFIIGNMEKAKKRFESAAGGNKEIATTDIASMLVQQYNTEIESGVKLIREYNALSEHILSFETGGIKTGPIISMQYGNNINEYCCAVRKKYWSYFLHHPKFTGQLTSNLKQSADSILEEMVNYDFNNYNIGQMVFSLRSKMSEGIESEIIRMFDEFSHKYSYYDTSSNIHYYNGWRTNKAWKINKKVILPVNCYDSIFKSMSITRHDIIWKFQDIERVFSYLDGGITDGEDIVTILREAEKEKKYKNIDTKYFTLTFFKKGTVWITFKDDELLKRFNLYGSLHKNWLPHDYGNKDYEDMTQEEKDVVDAFEGKASYRETQVKKLYKSDQQFLIA